MADLEIPADLTELKRAFLAQEQRLAEVAARMPSSMAIAGGEAEVSEADRAEWDRLWSEQGETVLAIHRHPALVNLSRQEQDALQAAAAKAARAGA